MQWKIKIIRFTKSCLRFGGHCSKLRQSCVHKQNTTCVEMVKKIDKQENVIKSDRNFYSIRKFLKEKYKLEEYSHDSLCKKKEKIGWPYFVGKLKSQWGVLSNSYPFFLGMLILESYLDPSRCERELVC